MKRLLSHVDLRVRDRARATAFYDRLLGALGMTREAGEAWTTYSYVPAVLGDDDPLAASEWIGFIEDPGMAPGSSRTAFAAETRAEVDRVAALLAGFGATSIEGPDFAYGPEYYAVFFEDPDGNRLEVCFIGA